MARKAVIEREKKRAKLVKQHSNKRKSLKAELQQCFAQLDDPNVNEEELIAKIDELQTKLDKLPRNASPKRQQNRCRLTGRPRGVYRKFRLSRNMLRKLAMMGLIPGVQKSSW